METHSRTLMKTLSWRFIATIITGSLGWFFTHDASFGLKIGLADTLIKLLVYYFHERTWTRIGVGYIKKVANVNGEGI